MKTWQSLLKSSTQNTQRTAHNTCDQTAFKGDLEPEVANYVNNIFDYHSLEHFEWFVGLSNSILRSFSKLEGAVFRTSKH